jgi:hypothetical protein
MGTIIIACHTIADEVNLAISTTGVSHPVCWTDSKLHAKPENLREHVQSVLNRISNVETVLLAFGYCGAGLVGVKSDGARLVLPKVEDCISLVLGSEERRRQHSVATASYYLTRGWIESEKNIADEWAYAIRRFGMERGRKLMRSMLKHYRQLTLIDTGAYDITSYQARTKILAEDLNLINRTVDGSQRLLEKLLVGPWDDEFLVIEPGREVTRDEFLGWS